jgi:peptidoglycan/LPS O-acetylase OafA/YrhL
VRIGQLSYGLYLWQYILIAAAEALVVPSTGYYTGGTASRLLFAAALTTAVGATFAAAALSNRYIERPALALKRRFRT